MTTDITIRIEYTPGVLGSKKAQHLIDQLRRLEKRNAVRVTRDNSTDVAYCLERIANIVGEVAACQVCEQQDAQVGKTRCVSCEANGW